MVDAAEDDLEQRRPSTDVVNPGHDAAQTSLASTLSHPSGYIDFAWIFVSFPRNRLIPHFPLYTDC